MKTNEDCQCMGKAIIRRLQQRQSKICGKLHCKGMNSQLETSSALSLTYVVWSIRNFGKQRKIRQWYFSSIYRQCKVWKCTNTAWIRANGAENVSESAHFSDCYDRHSKCLSNEGIRIKKYAVAVICVVYRTFHSGDADHGRVMRWFQEYRS